MELLQLPKIGPSENRIPLKTKHLALVRKFPMAQKKKKDKRKNNDQQNIAQKTKDRATYIFIGS